MSTPHKRRSDAVQTLIFPAPQAYYTMRTYYAAESMFGKLLAVIAGLRYFFEGGNNFSTATSVHDESSHETAFNLQRRCRYHLI